MQKNLTPSLTQTLYLKAPYLRQVRKRLTPYVIRLENLVQLNGQTINLSDGKRTISVIITNARRVPISTLDPEILKSLGYRDRLSFELMFKSFYHVENIDEITILKVIVQPQKRKLGFNRAMYSKYGIDMKAKP